MFPSGGWHVPSNVPLLDKMLPTLSKLENTKIVVAGYTDNVPIGAELKAKGVSNNLDLFRDELFPDEWRVGRDEIRLS
jgi:chemotaxis protein MotB